MKLWIGLALFIIGAISCAGGFVFNSETPMQVGPVSVIGGFIVAVVGLILFLSAI